MTRSSPPTVPFKDFKNLCERLAISPQEVTGLLDLERTTWYYWRQVGRVLQKYYDILKETGGNPVQTRTMALNVTDTIPFKEMEAYCKAAKISLRDAASYVGLTEGAARYWKRSGRVPKQHLDALQSLPARIPSTPGYTAEGHLKEARQAIGLPPALPDLGSTRALSATGWRLSDPNEMFHFMATELRNGGHWKILMVLRDDNDPDLITTVKVP